MDDQLRDLAGIGAHHGAGRREFHAQRDILANQPAEQVTGFLHHEIQIEGLRARRFVPAEIQQLPRQFFGALRRVDDLLQIRALRMIRAQFHLRELRVAENRGQQIVEIVRHAARQASDCLESLGLARRALGDRESVGIPRLGRERFAQRVLGGATLSPLEEPDHGQHGEQHVQQRP